MATRRPPSKKAADLPEAADPSVTDSAAHDVHESDAKSHPEETAGSALVKAEAKEESGAEKPRFHFFIIDSGWKSTAAQVLRENFHMIREFQNHDPLYILDREQSVKLIRANPDLIGKDPVLLVHDLHAKGGKGVSGYHGFRLCLGLFKDAKQALQGMQEFLRFIHSHRRSADIEKDIRERLHRQGFEGAIEVLRSGAQEIVGG